MNQLIYLDKHALRQETLGSIPEEFHSGILFLTLHGSHAYGTATATSDCDIRGVCIAPKCYYLGYLHGFEHLERKEPHDISIYELRKFFKLAADCNPNIIELLYLPRHRWLFSTPMWRRIVNNRDLFLSKKAKFTFSGYAISQLKRIKNHYLWLNTEEPKRPTREEFGLPNQMKMTVSEEQVVHKLLQNNVLPDPEIVREYITREQRYREAYDKWDAYTTWNANRNPLRHELEVKYGYDTKHALHLVRLMRMCEEILLHGHVYVDRSELDAQELLEIKNGLWTYDELITWAEKMDERMNELYQHSELQREPDRIAIDNLCQELIEEFLFTSSSHDHSIMD